ncbi:uL4 family ribosomal protein [Lyticum sinuosum]|uniref:Large ribosomal subunit protein uL4 n=1 Tax=Lyticum sinuosum TaxID=1332059 RepID=A0AAE4VKW7_9RICK|nr:uL4 family ribosomal protein [Lyticum sinuosum]MDZ5761189.1 50S ribosomal protein L4 [Lyticum sinuosum]
MKNIENVCKTLSVYNKEFNKIEEIHDPFDGNINVRLDIMHLAYRYYINAHRIPNRGIILRKDMSFSTKKITPQKGRGQARRGSRKAAGLRKGHKVHGPNANVKYEIKINKKVKKIALKSAFYQKILSNRIFIFNNDVFAGIKKTGEFASLLNGFHKVILKDSFPKFAKKTIFCGAENYFRYARNIKYVSCASIENINIITIMKPDVLIFDKTSFSDLVHTLKSF